MPQKILNQRGYLLSIEVAILLQFLLPSATWQARAETPQTPSTPYPVMAPINQYLMPDESTEIALARSAAPKSVSDEAEVLVLGRDGYKTAVKGKNGFVCMVERSWTAPSDDPDFWNPKIRSPICFNAPAARTYLPITLMKTQLVLAGKSKDEMFKAIASALDNKELPPLEYWRDVLHDVKAAVLERPRHLLASTSDVFCSTHGS